MLCSHVVFRQSVRRSHARLASTAAAEARKPRARPHKTPITTAAVEKAPQQPCTAPSASSALLPRRGPGRPRKAPLLSVDGNAPAAVSDAPGTRPRRSAPKDGRSDIPEAAADGLKNSKAKAVAVLKQPKASVTQRARSPKRRPSLLVPPQKHHDLASFIDYAAKVKLKPSSTVYRGHHYEYTVVETLKRYSFALQKMGRANDLGIDLLGTWNLPMEPCELRVLIQCKASRPRPSMVRELEGAYAGAPAGWKGDDVMALLITREPATPGVRDALERSRLPMGFAQVSELGHMQQFIWNTAAQVSRLTGMTVTNMYDPAAGGPISPTINDGRLPGAISLLWDGKKWSAANTPLHSIGKSLAGSQLESTVDQDRATC